MTIGGMKRAIRGREVLTQWRRGRLARLVRPEAVRERVTLQPPHYDREVRQWWVKVRPVGAYSQRACWVRLDRLGAG